MENVVSLDTVCAAIHQVQQFLEPYFSLANTHGAEFLSDDHWDKYVSEMTQTKILQLTHQDLVNLPLLPPQESGKGKELPSLHCSMDNSSVYQKGSDELNSTSSDAAVKDLGSFIYQAQKCHLENLDVLTNLEAVLSHCPSESSTVISEDMSLKKLHEVGIMVDTVSALFRSTQSDLVVDFGSGKGYFASELSLKGEIPVIGFDSKDSNTHGASLRDRKLARKWKGLERKTRKQQLVKGSVLKSTDPEKIASDENHFSRDCLATSQDRTDATTSSTLPPHSQHSTEKSNHSFSRYLNSVGEENNATQVPKNSDDVEQNLKKPCELYAPVTLYVHPELDLCKEIHEKAPHLLPECKDVSSLKLFLSGLHTCGSLAVTTLKLFLQDPHATNLCNVGCCYQLMEEQGLDPSVQKGENHAVSKEEIHFPLSNCGKKLKLHLGRNARNLASQSLPRLQASGKLQGGDFLWRALLGILLKELNIPVPEKIIGMRGLNKRCKTFQDYAAAAFEKLGISEFMPELHELNDLEARHKTAHAKMSAFFQLKLVLAPVIESLILLDRLAFLLEQETVRSAHLVQLFDPVKSPRCFALIATKRKGQPVCEDSI